MRFVYFMLDFCDCGEVGCRVVSSLRVAPPWRPAGNQRLILLGILRWLFATARGVKVRSPP